MCCWHQFRANDSGRYHLSNDSFTDGSIHGTVVQEVIRPTQVHAMHKPQSTQLIYLSYWSYQHVAPADPWRNVWVLYLRALYDSNKDLSNK